ncbi:MAG TPA: putative lipid II flippase FtsW [Actinocrinis sp.]|uniref:putative lipid II flippase FtsW n=1 Tax=Actinocrinis sp. TaxID=1920516 RepID=UPI002D655AE0|nr:putative lipid II flippase FtsW [Actinocrinis sp.]HZU58190.1 putative lipid II flippase FtsW [Actinocrinis sp.]
MVEQQDRPTRFRPASATADGASPNAASDAAETRRSTAPNNAVLAVWSVLSRLRPGRVRVGEGHPSLPRYFLIGATFLLIVVGLLEVYSASTVHNLLTGKPELGTIERQAISAAIGVPIMVIAARLPVRFYRGLAYPLLIVTLIMLLMVLALGEVSTGGNQNWLVFGPLTIQPSEFAKFALVLWGADLLARKEKRLASWDHLIVPLLPMAGLIIGLVMLGGDMGTSMIIAAIAFALLWIVGAPGRLFAILTGSAAGLATVAVLIRPSRVRRFTAFLDPAADPQGTGFQAMHSFSALSTGGWFGVGVGASREKWGSLPEAQTDFIFAIIGEELGLIGSLAVLALFALIGYAGVRIALRAQDSFVRLASGAVTAWLMVQVMINLGAVLGVLPIAGVPLPFVSYGGSSLLPSMAAIGMLVSFARTSSGVPETGDGAVERTDMLSTRAGVASSAVAGSGRPRPQAQRKEGRTT